MLTLLNFCPKVGAESGLIFSRAWGKFVCLPQESFEMTPYRLLRRSRDLAISRNLQTFGVVLFREVEWDQKLTLCQKIM